MSNNSKDNSNKSLLFVDNNGNNDDKNNDSKVFINRPSLGLKLWGPLVPAADNRKGLWTLLSIQTVVGVYAFYRFHKLSTTIRVSTKFSNVNNYYNLPPTLNRFTNPQTTAMSTRFQSGKSLSWKRVGALLTGVVILSQSCLEYCRLMLLPFDPWYDEAKLMRDKKFFNDIIKFYYYKDDKNIDSIKIVKIVDPTSDVNTNQINKNDNRNTGDELDDDDDGDVNRGSLGSARREHLQTRSLNATELRQSMAMLKAQREQANPVIKWFGPIDYKPMSFGQYLDLLEYYLSMKENLEINKYNNMNNNTNSILNNAIIIRPDWEDEYSELCKRNQNWREHVLKHSYILPNANTVDYSNSNDGNVELPNIPTKALARNIIIDPAMKSKDNLDLDEIWTLHDPWMNLALDTSLSIKFIPTSVNKENNE